MRPLNPHHKEPTTRRAFIPALALLTLLAHPAYAQESRAIIVLQLDDQADVLSGLGGTTADGMPSGQPGISRNEHQRR